MLSGLKIHKSKLIEIEIHSKAIDIAPKFIGYSTFSTPFILLELRYHCEITSLRSKGIDLLPPIPKKVGNGEDSLFWDDIWIDGKALKQKYPRLYALEFAKKISVAEKVNHSSLVWSCRRAPRGGVEDERQCLLQSRIDGLILLNMLDRWVWSLEALGEFLVKLVRSLIDNSLLPKEDVHTR
nr:hypothetical protein [Tanacetum cinerariifolium]GEX68880.1 hypothetical protein [Tanacetum cinerariifolium]